jgi:hypothetical protein
MDIHTGTEALITIAEEYTATAIIVTEVGTIINPKVMDGFEKIDLSPIYFASDSERGLNPSKIGRVKHAARTYGPRARGLSRLFSQLA